LLLIILLFGAALSLYTGHLIDAIAVTFLLMGADPIAPLTALMILWVNLISDPIPSLALGVEVEEPDLMQ